MALAEKIFELSGKVMLISGGTGFLGAQFSRALAGAGATVVAADLRPPDETGALERWGGLFGEKIFYEPLDITNGESVSGLLERIRERHGKLDVLVNCAAIDPKFERDSAKDFEAQKFTSFPLDLWEQSLNVNLTGTFLLTQAVCRIFEDQGRGNIINICSTYGLVGPDQRIYNEGDEIVFAKPVSYSVTKAAVLGFTRYLAAYYRGKDIRVNALTPGGVKRDHDEEFVSKYSARTTLGRMARPGELDGAIVFLASGASSYMSGANLVVDGGWTAI
jgi:2-deoxy-D-gluconate 3-dehydrogenase